MLEFGADVNAADNDGKTVLMTATEEQRVEMVRFLLEHGADPEQRTPQGYTLLMSAARGGNVEIAQLLIARGLSLNITSATGNTPLLVAAIYGRKGMQEFLLAAGAEVGILEAIALGDLEKARTLPIPEIRPLHWGYSMLQWAIRHDNTEALRLLLEIGIQFTADDAQGQKLIRTATLLGSEETLRLLVEAGMPLEIPAQSSEISPLKMPQFSALAMAVSRNDVGMAHFVIEQGADVNANDEMGLSPLLSAVIRGGVEMVNLLLDSGADINGTGGKHLSPLALAISQDNEVMVNLLLERGANPIDRTGMFSALAMASHSRFLPQLQEAVKEDFFVLAKAGDTEKVLAQIEAGTDINLTDEHSRSALHLAAQAGHIETVRALLEQGASLNLPGILGFTPLMDAVLGGYLEIVTLLLERGAEANTASERGDTALRFALHNKHTDIAQQLIDAGAKIGIVEAAYLGDVDATRFFLREGNDIDATTNGFTPLMAAATGGHPQCVSFLLSQGAKLNATDRNGHTALYYAVASKNVEMVNFLLDEGVGINACGQDQWFLERMSKQSRETPEDPETAEYLQQILAKRRGRTPLEIAAFSPDTAMVALLLERGANPNGTDTPSDNSPLHFAVIAGRAETVRLLLERGADVTRKVVGDESFLGTARSFNASAEIIELLQQAEQKQRKETGN